MEPITDNLSLRKQNTFFFEMESENCISTELWKDRFDWLADKNNLTSQAFKPEFCQGSV